MPEAQGEETLKAIYITCSDLELDRPTPKGTVCLKAGRALEDGMGSSSRCPLFWPDPSGQCGVDPYTFLFRRRDCGASVFIVPAYTLGPGIAKRKLVPLAEYRKIIGGFVRERRSALRKLKIFDKACLRMSLKDAIRKAGIKPSPKQRG
jgi:hypothetical protein